MSRENLRWRPPFQTACQPSFHRALSLDHERQRAGRRPTRSSFPQSPPIRQGPRSAGANHRQARPRHQRLAQGAPQTNHRQLGALRALRDRARRSETEAAAGVPQRLRHPANRRARGHGGGAQGHARLSEKQPARAGLAAPQSLTDRQPSHSGKPVEVHRQNRRELGHETHSAR